MRLLFKKHVKTDKKKKKKPGIVQKQNKIAYN